MLFKSTLGRSHETVTCLDSNRWNSNETNLSYRTFHAEKEGVLRFSVGRQVFEISPSLSDQNAFH